MDSNVKQIELGSHTGMRLKMLICADTNAHDSETLTDKRLENIQRLFNAETDAPLSELEQNLRAWTRSHLQTEHIQQVLTLSDKARNDFSAFVTVGIGGSDLSARVFHEIVNHPYHNLLPASEREGAPEVYFTGDTFDPIRLKSLLEMLKSRNLLHKTLFNVISKSGKTGETLATLMIIQEKLQQEFGEWRNQIVATTGLTTKSLLYQFHQDSPFYGILPVPEGVGGRFSAFSPVGLFFLAMTAGSKESSKDRINAAVEGVHRADENFQHPCVHPENTAYHLALWLDSVEKYYDAGTMVFYNYADNSRLGEWFVQLYTESIQERGRGLNVIAAKGPTSNHSILNGILAGPRDKAIIFIHWEDLGTDVTIPSGDEGNGLDAFQGLSMNQCQTASYRGTEQDFTEKNLPTITLTLPKRDISNMCELMRTLMDTVAVKGRLQELHLTDDTQTLDQELTYLQSAVEGYKIRTEQIAREMPRFK